MTTISAMHILRVGASAMAAHEKAIDVVSNNMANANTTGFGRSRVEFRELLLEQTELEASGVVAGGIRRIWRQGTIRPTGRSLDLAIRGEGFFQVALPGGRAGYTRAGAFQRSADGSLATVDGYRLVPPLALPEGTEDYHFNPDGSLVVRLAGGDAWVEAGRVQLATFANAEGLEHAGRGVYLAGAASGEPRLAPPGEGAGGQLVTSSLEDSSVDLGEEMVDLITAQRLYTLGLKIVQTADEMQSLSNQLLGR